MKKNLMIEETEALNLYKIASPEFKQMLISTFGEKFFYKNIIDRIKSYDDACEELGIDPVIDENIEKFGLTIDEIAYIKLKTIIKSLNEGWIPDWTNSNEYKYYCWFDMSASSGFGFSGSYFGFGSSCSDVGSRLCFKNRGLAEYAGKQFKKLYKDFIN